MPHYGFEKNVDNLDARVLQQFIMDNITPHKCLIVASGIKNHKEYVDLVKERLGDLLPVPEHNFARDTSEYVGGEYRTWTETPDTRISLAFESCPWTSDDVFTYNLMKQLLNQRMNSTLAKNNFVNGMSSYSHNFTDSGLFGMNVEGSGSHSAELMEVLIGELNSLKSSADEHELTKAKNNLKMSINMNLENSSDRLEEIARNYMSFGDINVYQYCANIDKVTS
jgi:predicted Zn-dependent peptidase